VAADLRAPEAAATVKLQLLRTPVPFQVRPAPRRTFAKLARGGQAAPAQIQLALGHQNIQTTQGYLGSELNLVDAARDRLGGTGFIATSRCARSTQPSYGR
jgi:integrase